MIPPQFLTSDPPRQPRPVYDTPAVLVTVSHVARLRALATRALRRTATPEVAQRPPVPRLVAVAPNHWAAGTRKERCPEDELVA
jgi:hypothetical protein